MRDLAGGGWVSEELERVYEATLEALRAGKAGAVATVIEAGGSTPRGAGAKMLILADGSTVGTVGGGEVEARVIEEASAALAEGRSREVTCRLKDKDPKSSDVCAGDMRILVEVLPPRPTLIIVGAGHVGRAVAELATFLGYRIVVVDERPEWVSVERFPWAETRRAGDPAEELAALQLTEHTCVVIVTPHHSPDERILAVLADKPIAYVGLMGSRRRASATFARAREMGIAEAFLERVHTPVGLDIGAETPREIAVSILGEIIAVQRRGG